MTINDIIKRLQEGNDRFVADKLDGKMHDSNRRRDLTSGQNPYAIILSCADSRVVPEFAFDTGLGELFVIRVAGNIANTETIASIEYAVAHVLSKVIVVLGHESCGAITAAVQGGDNGRNLNLLLAQITPAISAAGENATINDVVKNNVHLTIQDLLDRSKIIAEAHDKGDVKLVPAYYNLESGRIDFL